MAKFVLMFRAVETPEEPSWETMDRWMAWFGELGDAVVDTDAPFAASATITSDGRPNPGKWSGPRHGLDRHCGARSSRRCRPGQGMSGTGQRHSLRLYEARENGLIHPDQTERRWESVS